MITKNEYEPDVVSWPGETLAEVLEERQMTQAELAERMGRPKKTINEIIQGKTSITPETALQLEHVLHIPATFWNNRQLQYDEYRAKQAERDRLKSEDHWLKKFPIKMMMKLGWLKEETDSVTQLQNLLNFFAVGSVEQFTHWPKTRSFRKSEAFESDDAALAVWVRRGEIEGATIACQPYQASRFKEILQHVRLLTILPPEEFQPELVKLCATAGVAVVFVPELPKCGVSGAAGWLAADKALIQLSLRHKTNDHLWFTFFHEAAHILLHQKSMLFIDMEYYEKSSQEEEANQVARDLLISPKEWQLFLSSGTTYMSKERIKQFAQTIGIAPGIVVGRLQHEGHLRYTHCNELKVAFQWQNTEE